MELIQVTRATLLTRRLARLLMMNKGVDEDGIQMLSAISYLRDLMIVASTSFMSCTPKATDSNAIDVRTLARQMCVSETRLSQDQRDAIRRTAEQLQTIDEEVLTTILTHLRNPPGDWSFADWERPIIETLSRRYDPKVQHFLAKHLDSVMETPVTTPSTFSAYPCAEAVGQMGPAGLCTVLDYIRSADTELSSVYIQHASIIVYGSYNMDSERSTKSCIQPICNRTIPQSISG